MSITTIIISMHGEDKRREMMSAHLKERGFEPQYFDAIDGRQMDVLAHPDYLKSKRRAAHGRDLKPGELGCMLSHRAAYQYIFDQSYEHTLLLEDDARLVPETKEILEHFIKMDIDYDIVRLMGSPKVMRSKARMICPIYKDFFLTRMATTPGGAHATLISKKGAEKLIKATEKFAFPIDTVLGRCWETGVNAYSIKPAISVPDEENFETTIGNERHDKKIHLKGIEKLIFKINRPLFKLSEALGKRKQFNTTRANDLALSKKFS
tara:strand:- start:566 stop:1360 length:795 start_codon:yes stop_codon:yes gene_type:complete